MQSQIVVDRLSKVYDLRSDRRRSLKGAFIRAIKREQREQGELLTVLKNVSFEVEPGEVIGVVGENGAGKSTLLKLIAGILSPTDGEVKVFGRLAALLEIGLGFNQELTGRENALLYGSILGMTNREINQRMQDITDFSEIGSFLDVPMRKYSSGMQMRLAFAVAMNVDPDVLLLDEVFSVGDARFQKRSYDRLLSLIEQNKAVVLVSHDLRIVRELSTKVLFINRDGDTVLGVPDKILTLYKEYINR